MNSNKSYKEIQNISLISDDTFKKDLLYINYKNPHVLGEGLSGSISEIAPNDFHIKNKNIGKPKNLWINIASNFSVKVFLSSNFCVCS